MDLYLMQHGQATTDTEDPERPLTDAGRAAVQRVAKRARAADVRISGCLHSGKLRAEQTAQLLVAEIGVEPSVEARPGLAPNDPVVPVAQWLRAETEHQSLALVGHMPFLGRLASLLVVGDNNNNQVASCWPRYPTLDILIHSETISCTDDARLPTVNDIGSPLFVTHVAECSNHPESRRDETQ